MRLFKKPPQTTRTHCWYVSYRTRSGWRTVSTRQEDLELAKIVVEKARFKEIEMAADIQMLHNAAAMNAVFGRVIGATEAFDEWTMHVEAVNAPKTVERYVKAVKAFLTSLDWPKEIGAIGSPEVDKWINNKDIVIHAQTRNVQRSSLNSFLGYCHNEGWLSKNPVANVHVKMHLLPHHLKESRHRRAFEPAEFEAFIKVAKEEPTPYWYGVSMIGRYTGLRWGDVNHLEWAAVLPDRLVVWTDKRDRRVELPMPPELPPVFDLLKTHPENQPALYHIPERDGKVMQQRPHDSWADPTKRLRELLETAGVKTDLSFHSLRHTYATELAKSGLPITEIARRMGHFSEQTTLRYIHDLMVPSLPRP